MSVIVRGFVRRGVVITKGFGGDTLILPNMTPRIVGIEDIEQTVVRARMVATPGTIGGSNGEKPRPVSVPTPTRPLLMEWLLSILRGWVYG